MKHKNLIRTQPSLGETLSGIGVEVGFGLRKKLIKKISGDSDKDKALAVILEKLDEVNSRLAAVEGFIRALNLTWEEWDNRLKEIEKWIAKSAEGK